MRFEPRREGFVIVSCLLANPGRSLARSEKDSDSVHSTVRKEHAAIDRIHRTPRPRNSIRILVVTSTFEFEFAVITLHELTQQCAWIMLLSMILGSTSFNDVWVFLDVVKLYTKFNSSQNLDYLGTLTNDHGIPGLHNDNASN